MASENVASGHDQVPVQAGRVSGKPARKAEPPRGRDAGSTGTRNVVKGKATVGVQMDDHHGPITVVFG